MKTDRELLELAAKAAGIDISAEGNAQWSPFTDDGDALRLAVKLRMRVILTGCTERGFAFVQVDYQVDDYDMACIEEESNGDHLEAARRAIVRAAAAIGEQA